MRRIPAALDHLLNASGDSPRYRVINAGVPAYSSFQSCLYLKKKGLQLRPDIVLFYHEFNDYLPSSLRSSQNTEIGLTKTDKELYESTVGVVSRHLVARSAFIRYVTYRSARWKLDRFRAARKREDPASIGLPTLAALPQVSSTDGSHRAAGIRHERLPRRVSPEERLEILDKLLAVCRKNDIRLIVIHPSYRNSTRHECPLTRFCATRQVEVFEAHDTLHPEGQPSENLFVDAVHPTPLAHRRLAEGLCALVQAGTPGTNSNERLAR